MKYLACAVLLQLIHSFVLAQNFNSFQYLKDPYEGESYWGLLGSYSTLQNSVAPNSRKHKLSAFTFDITFRKIPKSKNKPHRFVQYKMLPDMLIFMKQVLEKGASINRSESSSITGGLAGWHRWAWDIKRKSNQAFSIGFALNDYFLGASYRDSNNELKTYEPQGWWLSAGPVLMHHFTLAKFCAIHSTFNYNFGFYKPVDITYAIVNNSYPKPHFLHLHTELVHKSGIAVAVDFSKLINRGNIPNRTQRLDLLAGYKFVF